MICKPIQCLTLLVLNVFIATSQEPKAVKLELGNMIRFYRINDSVYRSEQPNKKEFKAIENLGIRTVLNFRRNVKDNKKAADTDLMLIHQPLKSKTLNQEDIIQALGNIHHSPKPVLVHCWHGSDRTGVIIAAYRVVFDGWTKTQAIEEFRKPEFGYHENWYPFLTDLINALDVKHVKAAIFGLKKKQ